MTASRHVGRRHLPAVVVVIVTTVAFSLIPLATLAALALAVVVTVVVAIVIVIAAVHTAVVVIVAVVHAAVVARSGVRVRANAAGGGSEPSGGRARCSNPPSIGGVGDLRRVWRAHIPSAKEPRVGSWFEVRRTSGTNRGIDIPALTAASRLRERTIEKRMVIGSKEGRLEGSVWLAKEWMLVVKGARPGIVG